MEAEIRIVVDDDSAYVIEIELKEKDDVQTFGVYLRGENTFYTLTTGDIAPQNTNARSAVEVAFRSLENTLHDYLDQVALELGITRSK